MEGDIEVLLYINVLVKYDWRKYIIITLMIPFKTREYIIVI